MSFITLSKENYFYNLEQIYQRVASFDQIAVVLKDNSYGHGLIEIAQLAREFGITRAVVRSTDEAERISKFFKYILILSPKKVVENSNFYYGVNRLEDLERYSRNINIELKVDTGMHRLGISPNELHRAIHLIKVRQLRLSGFFTHFREADELSSTLFVQRKIFRELVDEVVSHFPNINIHSNNSAGLFRNGEKIRDEMVRVGIASYGYLPDIPSFKFPKLKPVLSLWGEKIGELKYPKPYFRVGYGGVSEVGEDRKVSIYDIGYSDGFRRLPDSAIKEKRFRTPEGNYLVGRVSMDSIALNSDREKIEIFNSVTSLAKILGTIEYEILVGLSEKIERRII